MKSVRNEINYQKTKSNKHNRLTSGELLSNDQRAVGLVSSLATGGGGGRVHRGLMGAALGGGGGKSAVGGGVVEPIVGVGGQQKGGCQPLRTAPHTISISISLQDSLS